MKKVLVAYTTNSGSTEDVVKVIAEELGKNGDQVTMSRLEEIHSITGFDCCDRWRTDDPWLASFSQKIHQAAPIGFESNPRGVFLHSHEPDHSCRSLQIDNSGIS